MFCIDLLPSECLKLWLSELTDLRKHTAGKVKGRTPIVGLLFPR